MKEYSTSVVPFNFEACEIRVVTHDDGSFSVVAKDVAVALEYTAWHHNLISHVPGEWKGSNPITTPGGTQEMLTLTEQGLYFFLGRSDKPKALPFQMWVYGEVLPSIRKTGSYTVPTAKPATPKLSPSERERLMIAREAYKTAKLFGFDGNMAILSAENYVRNALGGSGVLAHMGATHLLADERGKVYTPTDLGQLMNPPMSAIKFNLALEVAGLQKKELGGWLPTDEAQGLFEWADTGKKHSNGTPVKQLRWFKTVLDRLMSGGIKEAA